MLVFQECCKCWLLSSFAIAVLASPRSPPQQPFSCGGGYRVEVMGKRRPLKYNFLFSVPNLCTLVFQRCLVTLNRVSDNADNGFLAHNGETRRSWRADGGEIGMSLKVRRESRPEAEAAPCCRVGWEWGLKGDGLFANCGHFWPEHDEFNDHFNAWLNRPETWNATMVEGVRFSGFCFQSLYRNKECSFMVQRWTQVPTSVCSEWWWAATLWRAGLLVCACDATCLLSVPTTTKLPYVFVKQQNRGMGETFRRYKPHEDYISPLCQMKRQMSVSQLINWSSFNIVVVIKLRPQLLSTLTAGARLSRIPRFICLVWESPSW